MMSSDSYLSGKGTRQASLPGGMFLSTSAQPRPMNNISVRPGGPNPGAPAQLPFPSTQTTPARPSNQQGQYSGQSTIRPPKYIDTETTEASVNNTLARGQQAADERYQVKQMDRAGVSRGKGQRTAAQIQSAKEMASAANEAAETRANDQLTNAQMRADYEKARESEGLAIAGAQFGMNFAGMQARLAQQRAALELMFSLMR